MYQAKSTLSGLRMPPCGDLMVRGGGGPGLVPIRLTGVSVGATFTHIKWSVLVSTRSILGVLASGFRDMVVPRRCCLEGSAMGGGKAVAGQTDRPTAVPCTRTSPGGENVRGLKLPPVFPNPPSRLAGPDGPTVVVVRTRLSWSRGPCCCRCRCRRRSSSSWSVHRMRSK